MELNIGMLMIIMIISIILYFNTQCDKELYSNVRYMNILGNCGGYCNRCNRSHRSNRSNRKYKQ